MPVFESLAYVVQRVAAHDGDPVVGLFPEYGSLVSGRLERRERKVLIADLELLEAQNIGPHGVEPVDDVLLARPDGVHVPRGDLHRLMQ